MIQTVMGIQLPKATESPEALDELLLAPEPEPAFDDLASLAAWVCGASVGLIALRDKNDPWLKAAPGLPANASDFVIRLCGRALAAEKLLVIPDTHVEGGRDLPLRFFAGVPLVMPYGRKVGVLAVADTNPRQLDPDQARRLAAVAGQILAQLDLRRILTELAHTIGERHSLEQALRESEERYSELFENANDIVYTHDLAEHFTHPRTEPHPAH